MNAGAKYPAAGREWGWQWVFPAGRMYEDDESGQRRRHHLHETEAGYDIRTVLELLGHRNVATTMITRMC